MYPSDARRVRVDGTILDLACSVQDIARFMQVSGLQGGDKADGGALVREAGTRQPTGRPP